MPVYTVHTSEVYNTHLNVSLPSADTAFEADGMYTLNYTALHNTAFLYCYILLCTALYCTKKYCIFVLHCTALHNILLLYCYILLCTALHCAVLYFTPAGADSSLQCANCEQCGEEIVYGVLQWSRN